MLRNQITKKAKKCDTIILQHKFRRIKVFVRDADNVRYKNKIFTNSK